MKYSKAKKYKYILRADEKTLVDIPAEAWNDFISLDYGVLIIKKNYSWDGSTVPLKKWYSWIWDSDRYCKTASLIHDSLCQLIREGLLSKDYRLYADQLYKKMCIAGGMSKWQAGLRYWALRKLDKLKKPKYKPPEIFETF